MSIFTTSPSVFHSTVVFFLGCNPNGLQDDVTIVYFTERNIPNGMSKN